MEGGGGRRRRGEEEEGREKEEEGKSKLSEMSHNVWSNHLSSMQLRKVTRDSSLRLAR